LARVVTANASLISKYEISFYLRPVFFKHCYIALAGAIQKSTGATSASVYPTILAKGFQLFFLTAFSLANTKEQPASLILEAFPAVIVPLFLANTVGKDLNLSSPLNL